MFKPQLNLVSFWMKHNTLMFSEVRRIKKLAGLPEDELTALAIKKRRDIVDKAIRQSGFYKAVAHQHQRNTDVRMTYDALPIIYKKNIRGNENDFITSTKFLLKKAFTSGTTGSPLQLFRDYSSILRENAYVWYYKNLHGLNLGDRVVSLRGNLNATEISRFNKAENTLYLSSYNLSAANISKYHSLINEFKPKAILAYPSSVYSLVQLMRNANYQLDVPLIFTSSETLYEFQRVAIEAFFKGKILDWYGNAERTIALAQCSFGMYHEMPLYSYNEYKSDGIITTSLINSSFPLIKYYVDDTVELAETPCQCGRHLAIKKVTGRMDDVVKLPNGTIVGRMDVCFKGVKNIQFSQIIQEQLDQIKINIVPDAHYSNADKDLLAKNIKARLNTDIELEFNLVDESALIKSKSGKFQLVKSNIL